MNAPALLDVNVLVALFNPDHIHHETAHDWFEDHRALGWATCGLTELGLIRILSNPAYWPQGERAGAILGRLRTFCASGHHHFWPDTVSPRDELFDLSFARGYRQLTDIHLLGLATLTGGSLATFDRSIPLEAVRGATPETLTVISPEA